VWRVAPRGVARSRGHLAAAAPAWLPSALTVGTGRPHLACRGCADVLDLSYSFSLAAGYADSSRPSAQPSSKQAGKWLSCCVA
jgi:hypothetical protein